MRLSKQIVCRFAACFGVSTALTGCKLIDRFMGGEPTSEVKTTPEAKPLTFEATVPDGVMRTRSTSTSALIQEAHDQLAFASGQLREIGGLMDVDRVEVELGEPKDEGGVRTVPFKAKFPVSWSAEIATPPSLTLYLPKGGDHATRQAFYTAYAQTCADPAAADLAVRVFWYHYRPSRPQCAIGKGDFDRSLVARPTLVLTAKPK